MVVDDHVGVAVDEPGCTESEDQLHATCAAADSGYKKVNLSSSVPKARRGARAGVVLGAEFVAGSRLLGAERARRRELAKASLAMAGEVRGAVRTRTESSSLMISLPSTMP